MINCDGEAADFLLLTQVSQPEKQENKNKQTNYKKKKEAEASL